MSARTTSRRKPARPAAATELAKFPDPRTIEPRQAFDDELADDPLGTAQELAYDALDTVDARSRYALARRALAVSPLCADAWLVLAERPANAAHHRRALLERAVAAGERALGPGGVEAFDGPFWLAFKTRPYMRARHALAEDLWAAGEREAAMAHLHAMLALNPGDNQGLRYRLLAWHLEERDDAAAEALLAEHGDDAGAIMSYTRALFAFRCGGDGAAARAMVAEAYTSNGHVPRLLKAGLRGPLRDDGYVTLGGEDEAVWYVEDYGFAWRETRGAIPWLTKATEGVAPRRQGDPPLS